MKRKVSSLFSMMLAAVMVLNMAVTGMAAEVEPYSSSTDESFTITINPAYSGETYTAYKIFDVTYSGEDNAGTISYSYTIEGDSVWYSTVSSSNLFTLTQISGSSTYVVKVNDGVTGGEMAAAFSSVPEGAVVAATATPTFNDNADGSSGSGSINLDVTESGPGYYFVTTSLGSVVSIDTTNPTATIRDKNPVPGITKEVENESHGGTFENGAEGEGSQDTAQVGDIIEFKIQITNAANKSALTLHDYTGDGLTFNGTANIHVYLNDDFVEINANYYTVTVEGLADNCDFEIEFDSQLLARLLDSDVIIVTYEAFVNEGALEINLNDAFLTYGVGGRSVTVETETDVYGLSLKKVDGNGDELDAATFTLAYSDGTLIEFYFDGTTYTVHDSIDEEYADEETTTNILVGSATIFGFDAGTYTLTETEAPDGYNKLTSAITVTIAEDGTVSISGDTQGSLTDGTITVVNNAGSMLPGTGGIGTTVFYVIGVILILGAAVLFVTKKRLDKE